MTQYVAYAGKKYKITGVTGKYYLCEDGKQFRRLNREINIIEVKEKAEPAEKPKSTRTRKKKQHEEETEQED